jgi:hypothetical protein
MSTDRLADDAPLDSADEDLSFTGTSFCPWPLQVTFQYCVISNREPTSNASRSALRHPEPPVMIW